MVPGRLLGNPRLFHPKRFIPYPFQPAFNLWILCTLVLTLRSFGVRAEVVSAVIFDSLAAELLAGWCMREPCLKATQMLAEPVSWRRADVVHATFYGGRPYRLHSEQRLVSSLFDMTQSDILNTSFFQLCAPPMQTSQAGLLPLI